MGTYHVRRGDRELTDLADLEAILEQGRYATIAMARLSHGLAIIAAEPYLVTLSYGYDPDICALYFHTATEGLKHEFMKANPNVCATVVLDGGYVTGDCAHEYTSVVVRGRLGVVADRKEQAHGVRVLIEQQEEDPDAVRERQLADESAYETMSVLRLDIAEITGKRGR